jgi:methyltransferase (TIGR00027 family)
MEEGQPSRTAFGAAMLRAAHQVLEDGRIFNDPLALRIIGATADSLRSSGGDATTSGLRRFIAARSRFAEDSLAAARERGTRQLVVLGAGLDTYAYRADLGDLRIFEVDHPATQAWKRKMLADAGIAMPDALSFVPVDFERDALSGRLRDNGFDPTQRSFFTWLGVVSYLSRPALLATLGTIGSLPGGAEVVFDYTNPPETVADPARRAALAAVNERVASLGEVVRSEFETRALHVDLAALGFVSIEDLGPAEIATRFFGAPAGARSDRGAHILRAAT